MNLCPLQQELQNDKSDEYIKSSGVILTNLKRTWKLDTCNLFNFLFLWPWLRPKVFFFFLFFSRASGEVLWREDKDVSRGAALMGPTRLPGSTSPRRCQLPEAETEAFSVWSQDAHAENEDSINWGEMSTEEAQVHREHVRAPCWSVAWILHHCSRHTPAHCAYNLLFHTV